MQRALSFPNAERFNRLHRTSSGAGSCLTRRRTTGPGIPEGLHAVETAGLRRR